MLTPFDDYPVHQTALPLAHVGDGHPDFYDRFWFNGYTEELFFAAAMGLYPNRGVIDAAFSIVWDGVQRSVFASAPIPTDRTHTQVGPITVKIVEPMRQVQLVVDAPEHDLGADITFHTRTAVCEEPRQTRTNGSRLVIDITRATQLGRWEGSMTAGRENLTLPARVFGTKDRSWGIRPIADPAPAAPVSRDPQFFFLWAPLHFDDECLHYMVLEDEDGRPWSKTAVSLPVLGPTEPVTDVELGPIDSISHHIRWAPGTRRSKSAELRMRRTSDIRDESVALEPTMLFRMSGVGYSHPHYPHGRWHGGELVAGEVFEVDELDDGSFRNVHVQQVMRADWCGRRGLGVLEQLVIGPHRPSGFHGLLNGASVAR